MNVVEAFIRNDQYNMLKEQAQRLINAHASVNDATVLAAVRSLTLEKAYSVFSELGDEQKELIGSLVTIKDTAGAEKFLAAIKPLVIPFQKLTEQSLKKLFPKAKKLKFPYAAASDFDEMTYLAWDDKGSNRKFIIAPYKQKLIGLNGSFEPLNQKSLCVFCQKFTDAGMFIIEMKGAAVGTYIKRGNYICRDAKACNENISSLQHLDDFIYHVTGK